LIRWPYNSTLGYRNASPGTLGYRNASSGTLGYRNASPGTLGYRNASPGTLGYRNASSGTPIQPYIYWSLIPGHWSRVMNHWSQDLSLYRSRSPGPVPIVSRAQVLPSIMHYFLCFPQLLFQSVFRPHCFYHCFYLLLTFFKIISPDFLIISEQHIVKPTTDR
jgi:hypothetical protein